jgi:hypothetical protein
MIETVVQVIGLGGVVLWTLWEAAREEREDPGRPEPRTPPQRCPFCHADLAGQRTRCARCGTPHHVECWEDHGRCSVHGCEGGQRTASVNQRKAPDPPSTVDDVPGADSLGDRGSDFRADEKGAIDAEEGASTTPVGRGLPEREGVRP